MSADVKATFVRHKLTQRSKLLICSCFKRISVTYMLCFAVLMPSEEGGGGGGGGGGAHRE